mmetsp:Transcript_59438/g.181384  ORF Transcript_59438/g.181384 Transcript_59438/m.181384 type:complete len:253 (+) Transcript_59438:1136-1894(+)
MTQRLIEGKLTSCMLCTSDTMSCNSEDNCGAKTSAPPICKGRRSRKIAALRPSICASKFGKLFIEIPWKRLSEKDSRTNCRFSRRLASLCSARNAFSSVASSYLRCVMLTTNASFCSGSLAPWSSRTRDRAASEALRPCSAASEKQPPHTKTTSMPITMANTFTSVLTAAMALLPPSQSNTRTYSGSSLSAKASASSPGISPSSSRTGRMATSTPSVTGSAESLDSNASSKFNTREARYDFPARPSPIMMTG